jgi:hypothetical protein
MQAYVKLMMCLAVQFSDKGHCHPQGPYIAPCNTGTQGDAQVRGGGNSLADQTNTSINAMLYQLAAAIDSFVIVIGQL